MRKYLFISYPKSGRTWLRVIFDELGVTVRYDHMGTGSARPDWGRRWRGVDPAVDLSAWSQIIFLYRDPRDVVVSFFHQMHRRERLTPRQYVAFWLSRRLPPSDMHRFAAHPGFGIERVARYNLDWMRVLSCDGRAVLLSYERLQLDPYGEVRALLDFLHLSGISDESVRAAIDNCLFDRMRDKERSGAYARRYGEILMPADISDPDSYKVRRGQVGAYLSEMQPRTIDYASHVLANCDYFAEVSQLAAISRAGQRLCCG